MALFWNHGVARCFALKATSTTVLSLSLSVNNRSREITGPSVAAEREICAVFTVLIRGTTMALFLLRGREIMNRRNMRDYICFKPVHQVVTFIPCSQ